MSPVDSSAVDSSANAAKTGPEVAKKSEVLVVTDTVNTAQPKSKKKKRHDVSNEDNEPVSELPQEPSSVVNGSTKRHRNGEKSKEGFTQTSPQELDLEKEKKSKKRKRKEGAIEQTDTQLETLNEDEKKAKKRKHKEKRENGSPSKQSDVPDEETGHMEAVTTGADEVKEKKRKKRKDKKASAEKGATELVK